MRAGLACVWHRPCDDKENNKKNAICCGSLLGGKKSSLPLGEGNAAFSGASFCASWVLKSKIFQIAHTSESAWHGGTFGPFLGRLCLPLGLLMCALAKKIETASGGRKRTFVEELAVKEHLLC